MPEGLLTVPNVEQMVRFVFQAFLLICLLILQQQEAEAQSIETRLKAAYERFSQDPQLSYASHSLLVAELPSGKPVFAFNSRLGLAPASTQKVVTAAAAFELLTSGFRYQTQFDIGTFNGETSLLVTPSGDPSLGSTRYHSTRPELLLSKLRDYVLKNGAASISDTIRISQPAGFVDPQRVPDGWIVQDLGNYYGAGAGWFNWRENQYDLELASSASIGQPGSVEVRNQADLPPEIHSIDNRLTAGKKGSGDNAYIYLPLTGNQFQLKGTIPTGENAFLISGAISEPEKYFASNLADELSASDPSSQLARKLSATLVPVGQPLSGNSLPILSPSLDSLSYWFLRKSVNLYGEAFLKTIGLKEGNSFSTEEGLAVLRRFWQQQGIDSFALRMRDGSGLSPENRLTTESMVQVLRFAKKQDWFDDYFAGFPSYNGMRMKSGTISAVKGFCGYHRSNKTGKEYVFAFLVNNYSGSSGAIVSKMYQVLNELK